MFNQSQFLILEMLRWPGVDFEKNVISTTGPSLSAIHLGYLLTFQLFKILKQIVLKCGKPFGKIFQ